MKFNFRKVQFHIKVQFWTSGSKFNLAEHSEAKFILDSHSLERLGELSAQAAREGYPSTRLAYLLAVIYSKGTIGSFNGQCGP